MTLDTWNRIPDTNLYRGLIHVHADGSLYGTRLMDVYDATTKEWVATVGGRNITSTELDELARKAVSG